MPDTPAQMPMAWARSRGSVKVLVRMARVAGIMMAAPTPCSARAPMRSWTLGESAHSSEAAVKMPTPDEERPLAAVEVAEGAAGEHEGGQQQDERVDDPLQFAQPGRQLALGWWAGRGSPRCCRASP